MGRKLYGIIEDILLRQGVRKVYAVVTSANAPSVAFHKAIGYEAVLTYTDVGFKHGRWYDVIWLEKQQPADWVRLYHVMVVTEGVCRASS